MREHSQRAAASRLGQLLDRYRFDSNSRLPPGILTLGPHLRTEIARLDEQ